MTVEAVVFDVNETLTDMSPMGHRFTDVGLAAHTLDAWFAGVLRDGFALTALGQFRSFGEIAAGNLRGVLDDAQVTHVLDGFSRLDTHPDVPEALPVLAAAGLRLVTLTNGSVGMSEPAFARAGVLDLLEHRLSVEDVRCWKPAPAPYQHAARVCGLPTDTLAMVAVHPWDVHGAQQAGMVGVWVNRTGRTYPPYLPEPDIVVASLRDLPPALAQRR